MTLAELKDIYPQFEYYQDVENNRYLFSMLTRKNAELNSLTFMREVDYSCIIERNIRIDDKLMDETFINKLHDFFNT